MTPARFSAAEAVIGLYRRHGRAWAERRGGRLVEGAWLARFLAAAPPSGPVLDLGCGSGLPIARHLILSGRTVVGVDASEAMVALFRGNLPQAAAYLADMRGLELGRRFAGVLAWDSFFHLCPDDQRAMFAVFARHAAPGAALLFTSGPEAGERIGAFAGEPLYHASLDPGEYRALLDGHGFDVLAHAVEDPGCGGRTVWLARGRNAEPRQGGPARL